MSTPTAPGVVTSSTTPPPGRHAASPVPYPDADWEPGSALYTATAVPPGQLFTNKGPPGATVTLPTWLAGVTWTSGATEDSDTCHVPPLALMVASA